MQVSGKFLKQHKKNYFTINSNGVIIICQGNALELSKNMPVKIVGEFNEDILIAKEIIPDLLEESKFVSYYSGKTFKNIKKSLAKNIYTILNKYANSHNILINEIPFEVIYSLLKNANIENDVINDFTINFCKSEAKRKLYNLLDSTIFETEEIEHIYLTYGNNAYSKIIKNPYILLDVDIPFEKCDRLSYELGVKQYDKNRIIAIIQYSINCIYKTGSTCTTIPNYKKILTNIQRKTLYSQIPFEYFASKVFVEKFITIDNNLNIYPWKTYKNEKGIAREIKRLILANEIYPYKQSDNVLLDDDQVQLLSCLNKSGITLLIGGPGTGKTTTIKTVISEFLIMTKNKGNYYLCAPTGRAAVRITESSGYEAFTIHKLLNTVVNEEDNTTSVKYGKDNQLKKGLFIIDEMSMVDEELFLSLLEAIPSGSIVILAGDTRQLPSVNPGKVLSDLVESKMINTIHLTKNHRQDKDNLIVENYYKIIDYNPNLSTNDKFQIHRFSNQIDAMKKLGEIFSNNKNKSIYDMQILSFTRKGFLGTHHINELIAKNRKPELCGFSKNDKVIALKNNYENGYFNGNIGKIKGFSENNDIYVDFGTEELMIQNNNIFDLDFGWAITVHKDQGSEHKEVVIVIDKSIDCMLYNSIILTAITRATDIVHIISIDDALEVSITTKNRTDRITNLKDMLIKNLS